MIKNGQHFIKHSSGGGWDVIRSSIQDGQDFFQYEPEEYDIIISNPPFTKKNEVLKRLCELGKPFAILLPLNSLQGKDRFEYFDQGIQILSFDKRISYHNPENMEKYVKGCSFATAYFCRGVLARDLMIERLVEFEMPLKKNNRREAKTCTEI